LGRGGAVSGVAAPPHAARTTAARVRKTVEKSGFMRGIQEARLGEEGVK